MKSLMRRLAGMPAAQPNEAPSSWLTRAALAQGAPVKDLLRYLHLDDAADPDVQFAERACEAGIDAVIDGGRLYVPLRLLNAARRLQGWGMPQLLLDDRGRSRCRFCPLCLEAQPRPYLQIHTRFAGCLICPFHDCWMEDCCIDCGAWMQVPACLLSGGRGERESAYISHCMECHAPMHRTRPRLIPRTPDSPLEYWHWWRLDKERAELSLLYQGTIKRPTWLGSEIDDLRLLSRIGMLHLEDTNSNTATTSRLGA